MKKTIIIGLLGPVLDTGYRSTRWERWRPSVSVCQHEDLLADRFELLYQPRYERLMATIQADIHHVSPETRVVPHTVEFNDPWDFEEVYGALHDFAKAYPFNTDREDYLIHITTGTHVAQICLYLLTETRYLPAKLLQTSPPTGKRKGLDVRGEYRIIDLDLSKYDRIAMRFQQEIDDDISFLKSGIDTQNKAFNHLIEQIERVALRSVDPMLLMGPTGAGKSQLARRIYELKHSRRKLKGRFVEVNCATIRGDAAMSALFGHIKGSFTGAAKDREGLLRTADQGLLFLDEIGELGMDEQSMLLRAIEEKTFFPVGADREVRSDFQLICGTNRDLHEAVRQNHFRDDVLARINLWTFHLPGLCERREDIAPNVQYELDRYADRNNAHVTINKEARKRFLSFAGSVDAVWSANFRDLNAAITRMATLAPGGRITPPVVDEEIKRLKAMWRTDTCAADEDVLVALMGQSQVDALDRFDKVQLLDVIAVCRSSKTMSEAGRKLFAVSRQSKKVANDADRLKKYLAKFNLQWSQL